MALPVIWVRGLERIPEEMDRLEAALKRQDFSVTRVDNPNSQQMKRAFSDFINHYSYESKNRLLFYFSGHGSTRKVCGRRKGYLLTANAPNSNRDLRGYSRHDDVNAMHNFINEVHGIFYEHRRNRPPLKWISGV